jgi:hypothetical protein
MNVEIGSEAAQFPEKESINGIFVAVCMVSWSFYCPLLHKAVACPLFYKRPTNEKTVG